MKWIDVWAAGVEIQTLCIQHGLIGSIFEIGKLLSSPAVHFFSPSKKVRTVGSWVGERLQSYVAYLGMY